MDALDPLKGRFGIVSMDEDVRRTGTPIVAVHVAQIFSKFLRERVLQSDQRLERCLRGIPELQYELILHFALTFTAALPLRRCVYCDGYSGRDWSRSSIEYPK